jgi:signal transduction histidine kinase
LAIAERLTPLLGREIAVTSMPGRGTTFTLRLPTALGDRRA